MDAPGNALLIKGALSVCFSFKRCIWLSRLLSQKDGNNSMISELARGRKFSGEQ